MDVVNRCLCLGLMWLWTSACGPSVARGGVDCEDWPTGSLVLTEFLADPEGTDTGQEWMEWHNPRAQPVDLEGLTLHVSRPDGTQEKAFQVFGPLPVQAGGYAVFGDVRSGPLPAFMDASYDNALGALSNTGGILGVRCGSRVLDEVRYAGPLRSGAPRGYDGGHVPDAAGNDEASRWCDAPAPIGGQGIRGTPGQPNAPCTRGGISEGGGMATTCEDPVTGAVRPLRPPGPGSLIITEYMNDPKAVSDTLGEWIEVYARSEVDLNGVTLSNETSNRITFISPQCLAVEAEAYAVLARSADASVNGGLPPVLATFPFGLSNAAGEHALRLSLGGTLLDEVTWTWASRPGASVQVDPEWMDPVSNDDPEGFCLSPGSMRYGLGDQGSPGEENVSCGW